MAKLTKKHRAGKAARAVQPGWSFDGQTRDLGTVRAVGAALVRRDIALTVQPHIVGKVQPFGFVELSEFVAVGAGSVVEVIAPLFARAPAEMPGGIDLFLRVDSGEWVWWESVNLARGIAGAWKAAGLTQRFAVENGCLCAITGAKPRLELVPGGDGLIEWGCLLDYAMAEVNATPALVKVWL